jgi:hypothetical protein
MWSVWRRFKDSSICRAVELGHQKYFLPVSIAQRDTPAVVHEGDAAIDGAANNADRQGGIGGWPR